MIKQLSGEFGLRITNDTILEGASIWTFCSSMGVKRRLDYIFASNDFLIHEAGPCGILDLGSDHRAVRTVLTVQKQVKPRWEKKVSMKGWRPTINVNGNAEKYHEALDTKMCTIDCSNVENIEKVLYDAATSPGARLEVEEKLRPWQSPEIRELLNQRRGCSNSVERRIISKRISKLTRSISRKYQNEKRLLFSKISLI